MRSWRDIFDAEDFGRPTVTKRRFMRFPKGELDPWGYKLTGYSRGPGGAIPRYAQGEWEEGEEPYYSPYDILNQMRRRLERQPVKYTTDPRTGKVLAEKTMPRFELPEEMRGMYPHLKRYFGEGKDLSARWVLPKGALTGPEMISRHAPATDPMRQMGYQAGVSGLGTQTSMVSPQTFWPGSSFKVPWRQAGAGTYAERGLGGISRGRFGAQPEPVFGATIDYTTGEWRLPPAGGGVRSQMRSQPYGAFEKRFKTPPGVGRMPKIGPYMYPRFQPYPQIDPYDIYRQRQRRKKMYEEDFPYY
ncbi:hypothetical protein ES703_90331 [subsurface metagenome]